MRVALVFLTLVTACSDSPQQVGDASSDAAQNDVAADGPASLDQYGPWFGGYTDGTFPISVWLQSPSSAASYASIGVNRFIGLYNGPTQSDLDTLSSANMPAYCDQNSVGLANLSNKTIAGWT